MSSKKYRLIGFIVALALAVGTYLSIEATGNTYYVSTTGNDANPGSASQPFRTFRRAISVLTPGDTLEIYGGTYRDYLEVKRSGTSGNPITIRPVSGQRVIIDGEMVRDRTVKINAHHIVIRGLETQRALQFCVDVTGSNVTVRNFTVHDCQRFGIRIKGKNVVVEGSTLFGNARENYGGILGGGGGWPTALRIGLGGENITLRNNNIYNNWGEGIGIGQGKYVNVLNNIVHDNYSQNIYVNNSMDVNVENNFVFSVDPTYFRTGSPANCIAMAEEYYENWGAQLARIRIVNNIAAFCKRGIGYTYSEVSNGGMDTVTIAHNTIWGVTDMGIVVINVPSKTRNSVIANNIVYQSNGRLARVEPTSGITFYNNFWAGPISVLRNASGQGDRTGDVLMATTPSTSPGSFQLSSSSPAIGGAADLGVAVDFEGKTRSLVYDMGAIEYPDGGSAPLALQAAMVAFPTETATLESPSPTATVLVETPYPTETPTVAFALPTETATLVPFATETALLPLPSPTDPAPVIAAGTPPQPFPVATIYDDKDALFVYGGAWADVDAADASSGSFKASMQAGSTVDMTFSGQSFSLLYPMGSTFGKVEVWVDGIVVGIIDQYSELYAPQQRWDLPVALPPGPHALRLVHQGDETSHIALDAITIYP